jgi:hypothetical protein
MHGPTLPVAILVSLHLIEARVLAQGRIHISILALGEIVCVIPSPKIRVLRLRLGNAWGTWLRI